ncbi:MAG: phosphoglycerate kinase [Sulfolobales archaeon]|nr:phosphoglycerate kinase [Sulfolobales archaeon]MDW8082449.1 phosphoglycerate kinase [Sulfolobales archaeon]
MLPKLPVLEDVNARRLKTLVRVDFNVPLDSEGRILDVSRIRAHVTTIRKLLEAECAVVLMSHQGRPGEEGFTQLKPHSEILSEYLGLEVKFVEDIIGPTAISEIKGLNAGEVLLLDNVRFVSEELIEAPPEVHSKSFLVRRLAPLFDLYVFDAFATAHRSQPSIVGFPPVLRSVIGYVMKSEVEALRKIVNSEYSPRVFVLGGAKIADTLKIIENLSKNRLADRILTTGLVALVFHAARGGKISEYVLKVLEERGLMTMVPRARRILMGGAPIDVPLDYVVVKDSGTVDECPASAIAGVPMDIGTYTMQMYSELMKDAKLIVMRGPAGYLEDPRFRAGSESLISSALRSGAFLVIGGGHLGALVGNNVREKMHISTGGGALLMVLAGEELPAIKALRESARKFFEWSDS